MAIYSTKKATTTPTYLHHKDYRNKEATPELTSNKKPNINKIQHPYIIKETNHQQKKKKKHS